jgi:SAM-dependent methyltransferase
MVPNMEQLAPETPGIVIGNHTPKYTSKNRAIRWLTQRWVTNLERLFDQAAQGRDVAAERALEVGCGEGVISAKLRRRWGTVLGLDLPDAGLRAQWRERAGPHFAHADAHRLPFPDKQFDVLVSVEVLEHLTDPVRALREMVRVTRRDLILSVPREPIFRACNLAGARYVSTLGNTPGHLNHWSASAFERFVATEAEVLEVTHPFPWTTVWARVRV